MSEKAREYLTKAGLIQSPFISQERVIEHLQAFADQEVKETLEKVESEFIGNPKKTLYEICNKYR